MTDNTARELRHKVRMGDLVGVRELIKTGADYAAAADTLRRWTPLHIACHGSQKPHNDRDIVEEILKAAKAAKKEHDVSKAKDAVEGLTPLQLAAERRDAMAAINVEDKDALDEKRKVETICEWVEHGWKKD